MLQDQVISTRELFVNGSRPQHLTILCFFAIMILLIIIVLSSTLGQQTAASYQSQHSIEIIRQGEDMLVLYVASNNALDLNTIEFHSILNNQNIRYDPFLYFNVLQLNDGILQPGTCLIIERIDTSPTPPIQCIQIFRHNIIDANVFWYDLVLRQALSLNILQQNDPVMTCPGSIPSCSVHWTALPTPTTLPPITPDYILAGNDNSGEEIPYTVADIVLQTGIGDWATQYNGDGVKIGVIDRHFGGLDDTTMIVYPNHNFETDNLNQGTGVLEIINNIAPQAERYACQYDTFADFTACVDWMIQSEVQIINHSAAIPLSTSASQQDWAKQVEIAANENILWIDAASNYQTGILSDTFFDQSIPNGRHEFSLNGSEALGFSGIRNSAGTVMLVWDDFQGQAANMYDLDLIITDATTGQIIAQSNQSQTGNPDSEPFEIVTFDMREPFGVQILNSTNQSVVRLPFTLFVEFALLDNPNEGFTTPADSPFALTIGVGNESFVADYSLHGSRENRLIPDMVAPGNIMLNDGTQFIGTSAAAPIVSGYAALVLQHNSSLSGQELREFILFDSTQDDPFIQGRDIVYGEGYLDIPPPTLDTLDSESLPTLSSESTIPSLEISSTPSSPIARVIVNEANLRVGPHVSHERVGSAFLSDELPILGQAHGWFKVEVGATNQTWIAGSIVEVVPENAVIDTVSNIPDLPPTRYPEPTNDFPPPPPTVPGKDVPGAVINTPTRVPRTPQSVTPIFTVTHNIGATQTSEQGFTVTYDYLTAQASLWTNTPSPTPTFTPSMTKTASSITATFTPPITLTRSPTPTTPSQTQGALFTVGGNIANLRSGPDLSFAKVGSAQPGEQFRIIAQSQGVQYIWYLIEHPTLGRVWIANVVGAPNVANPQIPVAVTVPFTRTPSPGPSPTNTTRPITNTPLPTLTFTPSESLIVWVQKTTHTDFEPPCQIGIRVNANQPVQGQVFVDNAGIEPDDYPDGGLWSFPGDFTVTLGGTGSDQDHSVWAVVDGVTYGGFDVRCDTP